MNINKINGFPVVEPNPEKIPDFLKAKPWAVWIAEPRPNKPGKFNKAPLEPCRGSAASTNNPATFGTFAQAVAALDTGRYSGMGVLLTGEDETIGVDIDDYEKTFAQMPQVGAWVAEARKAGAYCEKSPSGKGLRLFVRGKLPGSGRKAGSLEIYDNARFLTVTGKAAKGSSMELIDGQALAEEFLAMLPAKAEAPVIPMLGTASADPAKVEELVKRVAAKHGELWAGNWEMQPVASPFSEKPEFVGQAGNLDAINAPFYPSQSEADFAICGHIAREAVRIGASTDALNDTVMSVFKRSGLYRAEKRQQVESYAIPKIVAEVLAAKAEAVEKAEQVTQTDMGAELAANEPGDILAGQLYARAMRGKLLFVTQAGRWTRWDGTRWCWCSTGEEMAAAKYVAGKILDHATTLFKADPQSVQNKKRMAFAAAVQNLKRLQAMVELAKTEDGMSIGHMTQLDSDRWLLGVRNGVVNLKDGGLLAPNPTMLITRQAAAEYHDDAQCPRWLAFLDQIFEGDQDTIAFVQRALGYSLTGVTTEEALFICFGSGANGKSVFSNVLTNILADYSQAAPPSLLTVRRDGDSGPRNDIARLCGARSLQINELQQGDRLDEQIVKMLAGREMLSARFLHKEFFDFWPTAKPWLRTNHKPIITGEDDGIWRRLHLIPFRRKFSEGERDPWLEPKLLEERDGILAWMVRGCLEWHRIGLKPSATVRRESAAYRKESDLLGEFLDERTVNDPASRVEQGALFGNWRGWNEANGTRSGSKISFTRKLAERGVNEAKSNGKRFYAGLKLREGGM